MAPTAKALKARVEELEAAAVDHEGLYVGAGRERDDAVAEAEALRAAVERCVELNVPELTALLAVVGDGGGDPNLVFAGAKLRGVLSALTAGRQ